MTPPIYVLGTGLSHNGSAVLLKNGRVCVGIEKERISRKNMMAVMTPWQSNIVWMQKVLS